MRAAEIAFGWLLDLLLGDPAWMPHPVSGIGKAVSFLEKRLYGGRAAGALLVLLVAGGTWGLSWGAVVLASRANPWLGTLVGGLLFFMAMALKTLDLEARAVAKALTSGDLSLARTRVARIVGRDTQGLDEAGVARAAVEAVAESTVDGVTAPLFFAALGGGPLALAYRAVNTMDSMIGHKDARYARFGWAAARLDDLLSWIPARLTALLLVLSSALCGEDAASSWRILRRDRLKHASPNAGHPESAVAGALGIQLGGPVSYGGQAEDKPWLGDGTERADAGHILRAVRLLHAASFLALGIALAAVLR